MGALLRDYAPQVSGVESGPLPIRRESSEIPQWVGEGVSSSDASIDVGRKEDVPEVGCGSGEFNGDERAFLIELGWAHDVDFDFLLRTRILKDEFRSCFQALRKNDHAAGGADGVRGTVDGLVLAFQVNPHRNAQEDALRATALLSRRLALQSGPYARRLAGPWMLHPRPCPGYRWFHSSRPQKSISGATSSTPYSHPSGRDWPLQTMMAALLDFVARLVRATRCRSEEHTSE